MRLRGQEEQKQRTLQMGASCTLTRKPCRSGMVTSSSPTPRRKLDAQNCAEGAQKTAFARSPHLREFAQLGLSRAGPGAVAGAPLAEHLLVALDNADGELEGENNERVGPLDDLGLRPERSRRGVADRVAHVECDLVRPKLIDAGALADDGDAAVQKALDLVGARAVEEAHALGWVEVDLARVVGRRREGSHARLGGVVLGDRVEQGLLALGVVPG